MIKINSLYFTKNNILKHLGFGDTHNTQKPPTQSIDGFEKSQQPKPQESVVPKVVDEIINPFESGEPIFDASEIVKIGDKSKPLDDKAASAVMFERLAELHKNEEADLGSVQARLDAYWKAEEAKKIKMELPVIETPIVEKVTKVVEKPSLLKRIVNGIVRFVKTIFRNLLPMVGGLSRA